MPIPLIAATQAPHGVAALATALDPGLAAFPMGTFLALGLFALGLTRITAREAVDSPVRRALVETLAEGRMFTATELARRVGISRKTCAYHLRILTRAGLAVQRLDLGRPLFGRAGVRADPAIHLLQHRNRRAVWDAARAAPGATVHELARATGMKPGTAYFHAQVLVRAGLLEPVGFGHLRGFIAAQALDEPAPPPGADAPASA